MGIDRLRAVQAPMHTHDTSGQIWLEGRELGTVTLGQFFMVWGCGSMVVAWDRHTKNLQVIVDGEVNSTPTGVRLADSRRIEIRVSS